MTSVQKTLLPWLPMVLAIFTDTIASGMLSLQVVFCGCDVAQNVANVVGGISAFNDASLISTNGTWLHHNFAEQGGGIQLGAAKAWMLNISNDSIITLNSAKRGGGLFAGSDGFSLHEVQTSVVNNSADHDPDVSSNTTTLSLISNSTVMDFVLSA